ncbi:glycine cleavage system aminomethyltransferase GcvT [Marinilactibacillus psychrotolerans]|uniref:glycine cleavage system aminomethyltransferase GcvT n=1 Tax=Marinilactibacillus psychrotolerans TaxID=191770 RepID=UPI0038878BFE
MSEETEKLLSKTPLYDYYKRKAVKLIDFGGWALPIQFTKLAEEHQAVREHAGMFDVSHMGEIMVQGEQVADWLNKLVTNDVQAMKVNQAQYNTMTNEAGGTLDDLLLFKFSDTRFLVTPNAANTEKIYKWMESHKEKSITIENISNSYGLIALQGPKAERILTTMTQTDLSILKSYSFFPSEKFGDIEDVIVARTGYTGEDGFELYVSWHQTQQLWDKLLKAGAYHGLKECGLGARDTLRLEAGMSLYGHELTEEISPLEGGVGFAVKVDKKDSFIGQEALRNQKKIGLKRVSRGFELIEKGIARNNYPVLNSEGEIIGTVTSGTQSPTLVKSIGMMLIDKEHAAFDHKIWIQVRKKQLEARITKKDWLKNREKKKEGM